MIRSTLTIAGLTAALFLAGCATQEPAKPMTKEEAAAAAAHDAATAAKLKGNWTGKWELPGYGGGKFELIVTEVAGTAVTGSANWYGTAAGDTKGPLSGAVVKNGQLTAKQGSANLKLTAKDDKTLTGTWEASGYSGPLNLTR
ncbi:MAG: hypothetical protein JSS58_01040 [Proteobacteria bacterium]|nr:hypothetical protein [Pseudomonadota bacterium]